MNAAASATPFAAPAPPEPAGRLTGPARWLATVRDTGAYFFWRGPEPFLREKQRRHGSTVFHVHLWQPTIAMLDAEAISVLFDSADLVQDYGFSWARPPRPLVGNVVPSIFEAGPAHDQPKALYRQWLMSRLPHLSASFERVSERYLDRWDAPHAVPFPFRDQLEDYASDFLFDWYLGHSPDPGSVRTLYLNLFGHPFAWLTRFNPNSLYARSLRLHGELLAFVQATPAFTDVLARAQGLGLTDADAIAKQILFMIGMNSFLGLQNLLKSMVGELSLRPEWAQRVRLEVETAFGPRPAGMDPRRLDTLPLLDGVLREVLRLHPPVSNVFGRATRDRIVRSRSGTFAVRRGDLLMGVIPNAHRDPAVFPDPDTFNPARYQRPEDSRHLIWARGPHDAPYSAANRTCPGKDVALLATKLFCAKLLTHATWTLAEPPAWNRASAALNAAAPEGPMDVAQFSRRR